MRIKHQPEPYFKIAGATAAALVCAVAVVYPNPARSQTAEPKSQYIVVWKSRYNEKNYRSEWYYGDPQVANSVADELRQFHAFTDVRVITVPVILNSDGISGKLVKDDYARRGTGAFTVSDLWNYTVPGSDGGGDSRVISLRKADSSSQPPSGATTSGSNTNRPVAPSVGGQGSERLIYDEGAPKRRQATAPSPTNKLDGANERAVKEETLRAKGDVLQSQKQQLDTERLKLNQGAIQGEPEYSGRLAKYRKDLEEYKSLVSQLKSDLDHHNARYDPVAPPAARHASPAPLTPHALFSKGDLVGRTLTIYHGSRSYNDKYRILNEHSAQYVMQDGQDAHGRDRWDLAGDTFKILLNGGHRSYRLDGDRLYFIGEHLFR
jgi:hypothetical protein